MVPFKRQEYLSHMRGNNESKCNQAYMEYLLSTENAKKLVLRDTSDKNKQSERV